MAVPTEPFLLVRAFRKPKLCMVPEVWWSALNLDAVCPLTCLCDSVLSSHILFLDLETIFR